jgi:hypothetical protein
MRTGATSSIPDRALVSSAQTQSAQGHATRWVALRAVSNEFTLTDTGSRCGSVGSSGKNGCPGLLSSGGDEAGRDAEREHAGAYAWQRVLVPESERAGGRKGGY